MPHQLQHLDRAVHRLLARPSFSCSAHHLGDLVADRVDRVERGHRLLEDHARSRGRGSRISCLAERHQVPALPQDLAGRRCGRAAFDQPQHRERGDALAAAAIRRRRPASRRGRCARSTPSTARTTPSSVANQVFSPRMSSRRLGPLSLASQHPARIERVAQPVTDEVDRQHGEEDRAARRTAPSAARCRDSPWRRTARAPRSGCPAGSRGRGRTASIRR